MVRYIYILFLGVILALFVGLGISTFYEGPKEPEYPTVNMQAKVATPEQEQADRQYQAAFREFEKKNQPYNRNVSVISLIGALVLLVVGFMSEKRNSIIGSGVILGGLFTMMYSIIRGFVSTDTKYTFIVVTIGVAIALYLGYRNFTHFAAHERKHVDKS